MQISLTHEQKEVVRNIFSWLKDGRRAYLTVGGYAGTGKTTMLSSWRKILFKLNPKAKVAFCAYTGKASRVLQTYLKFHAALYEKDSVSTIHSLIYAPILDKGKVTGWKRKSKIDCEVIVVDEASMVDEGIWTDLQSFELPILAIGDHGQLPPVQGSFNLMKSPDFRLETIHRQAEGNPIIQLSMRARTDGVVPIGEYGQGVRKLNRYDSGTGQEVEDLLRSYNPELLILVGFNHTRVKLNQTIRAYQDINGEKPRSGDRVICLKNNWEKGIYNGMQGNLVRLLPIEEKGKVHWYEAEVELEDGNHYYTGKISAHQFNEAKTLRDHPDVPQVALGDLFDFGYALTVHKAQGSQARKVLLFEERSQHMDDEDWRRWLYTGITRAEEYLTIIGS
jgi:exodeoxyribonuclease V